MLLLVSLTEERAIYLALELDRSWTEMSGVNPYDGWMVVDPSSREEPLVARTRCRGASYSALEGLFPVQSRTTHYIPNRRLCRVPVDAG